MSKPTPTHPWRKKPNTNLPERDPERFVRGDRSLRDIHISTDGIDYGGVASPFKNLDQYDRRDEDMVSPDD